MGDADATSAEESGLALDVPPLAAVPLALAVTLGDKMSIGVQIQSSVGHAHEGVWLALELTGGGKGKAMSVLCAPLTGRCMMKYPGNTDNKLVAAAMPPLADDRCMLVEIYVTVSEEGDVEFVRFCEAENSVTRSGKLCRDMFPGWTTEFSTAINIQIARVSCETNIATKWSARDLPRQLLSQREFIFDEAWSLYE